MGSRPAQQPLPITLTPLKAMLHGETPVEKRPVQIVVYSASLLLFDETVASVAVSFEVGHVIAEIASPVLGKKNAVGPDSPPRTGLTKISGTKATQQSAFLRASRMSSTNLLTSTVLTTRYASLFLSTAGKKVHRPTEG